MKPAHIVLAAIFLALLAIGMQCEDARDSPGKTRKRNKRLRRLQLQEQRQMRKQRLSRLGTTDWTPTLPLEPTTAAEDGESVTNETTRAEKARASLGTRGDRTGVTIMPEWLVPSNDSWPEGTDLSLNVSENVLDFYDVIRANRSLGFNLDADGMDFNLTEDQPSEATIRRQPHSSRYAKLWRERKKQVRKVMIQAKILHILGLTHVPNITSPFVSDDGMETLMKYFNRSRNAENGSQELDKLKTYYAESYQTHVPSCEYPRGSDDSWSEEETKYRLYFKLSARRGIETTVSSASLRLYKRAVSEPDCMCHRLVSKTQEARNPRGKKNRKKRPTHRRSQLPEVDEEHRSPEDERNWIIRAYQYTKPIRKNRRGMVVERKKLVDNLMIPPSYEGWVKFDIKSAVSYWMEYPQKNFGMVVEIKDRHHNEINPMAVFVDFNCSANEYVTLLPLPYPLTVTEPEPENSSQTLDPNRLYPKLDISSENHEIRRRREAVHEKGCYKEDIYVSFSELGLNDWIIQPQGFQTGICRGTCPTVTTNYKHSQNHRGKHRQKHNKSDTSNRTEKSNRRNKRVVDMEHECCKPSRTKPLRILHFDERGKIAFSILDDFIVDECGSDP